MLQNTLDYGTHNQRITTTNSSEGGNPLTNIIANGSVVNATGSDLILFSNVLSAIRAIVLALTPTGQTYIRWDTAGEPGRVVVRRPVYLTSTPTEAISIALVRSSAATLGSVYVHLNRSVRLAVGSSVVTASASPVLELNTLYWVELAVTPGASGNVSVRVLNADESEQHLYSHNATVADGPAVDFRFGFASNGAMSVDYLWDIQASPLATGWLGPIGATQPLATPVVTIDQIVATSNISTPDGSARATWPAVPNAGGYRALTASYGATDYEVVQETVTSPYVFTGLPAGGVRLAIQAKA